MTNYMYKQNKTKNDISHDTLESAEWQDFMKVTQDDYYVGKVYTYIDSETDFSFTEQDLKEVTDKYENFGENIYEKARAKLAKKLAIETREKVEIEDTDDDIPLVYDAIMGELIWKKIKALI